MRISTDGIGYCYEGPHDEPRSEESNPDDEDD